MAKLPSRIGRGKAPETAASCVSSLAAPFELNPKQEKNVVKDGDSVHFSNQFNRDKVCFTDVGESRSWLDVDCHLRAFNELAEFYFALILFLLQRHVSLEN